MVYVCVCVCVYTVCVYSVCVCVCVCVNSFARSSVHAGACECASKVRTLRLCFRHISATLAAGVSVNDNMCKGQSMHPVKRALALIFIP